MNSVFPYMRNLRPGCRIVVLSGAGVSQESGLATFRENNGLWEEHDVYEVATPEAWSRNPELVQRFYNARRKQLLEVFPNDAHKYLAKLEEVFEVVVVTQNVDDLHERGGSSNVVHLHGELRKSRSTLDESLVYDVDGWEITMEERCEKGSVLRPHVVWFGEMVPMIEEAASIVQSADFLLVVGTSLSVYPAAGLLHEASSDVPVILIDPGELNTSGLRNVHHIREKATVGVKNLVLKMLEYQKDG
ncbi:SIR2 family NAD-dependent protein deacylase [Owenweeksia hongkongensis]|uniref:SIR2 family NAD-dependent protein deacylase n=1 Tax=Owenweeksia hongkongensis TaxID=253245 RepID=UPI003A95291B